MNKFFKKIQSKMVRNEPIPDNHIFDVIKETKISSCSMVGVVHQFTLSFNVEGLVTNQKQKNELQEIFVKQIEHELYDEIYSDLIQLLYKMQMTLNYETELIEQLENIINKTRK